MIFLSAQKTKKSLPMNPNRRKDLYLTSNKKSTHSIIALTRNFSRESQVTTAGFKASLIIIELEVVLDNSKTKIIV